MFIFLNENKIKDAVGTAVFNRGLDIYLRNKVKPLVIDVMTSNEMLISSTVESSYGNGYYLIKIYKTKNTNTGIGSCSCQAFKDFKKCKHLVAASIKYIRESSSSDGSSIRNRLTGLRIVKDVGEELLQFYKDTGDNANGIKTKLNLEVKLVIENIRSWSYSLELKIGATKLYVIKNVREFLELLKNKHKTMEFGKGFILDLNEQYFSTEDERILEFLQEIHETTELLSSSYTYYGSVTALLSGKKANLTELQLMKLISIMQDKFINLKFLDTDYPNLPIYAKSLPLNFSLDLENNIIKLTQLGTLPEAINERKSVFLYENAIYMPSSDEINALAPLLKVLTDKNNNSISFNKSQSNDVATYLFPKLRAISNTLLIDDNLKSIINEEPLNMSFYLDKFLDDLTCNVKFTYGDITFDSINNNSSDENIVVIRDIAKESEAINTLQILGFKKSNNNYVISDEDLIADFITEGIPLLNDFGDLYYSQAFKDIKIVPASSFKSSIALNKSDLLEFDFNIDGVEREELKNVFKAVKERKKYYRLKNGSILPLATKELSEVYELMNNLDIEISKLSKGNIIIPKYASLYIDENLQGNNLSFISRDKKFRDLINTIKDIKDSDYEAPALLNNVLRGYQKIGFKWFKTLTACGFGGILGDEMGLGKTLEAISFMASQIQENTNIKDPILVVCPTSLVFNWINEIEKFAPYLKTLAVSGNKNDRVSQIDEILDYDVIITSYPLLRRDIEAYKDITFRSCFIDEAQHIKNPASQNAQAVKDINSNVRFALTGTPIENSLTELWSIFDFIMPGYLKNHSKFMKKYEIPIIKDKDVKVLKELTKLIKPFILRRFKKDVVKELPPKIEHKVVVEMTVEQRKLYASYVNSFKEEIKEEIKQKGLNKSKFKILSLLTRLRQICCDPLSFIDNYQGGSGKLLALEEILENAISSNHRILLFSQFTSVLSNIKVLLDEMSIKYMYLDGSVPSRKRMDMVNDFNEGNAEVFLISLKAGGTGLNLTGADMVIHFDPWWNPAVEEQAIDRAHRIGQTKTVEVIRLIAKGTIEEKIFELQEKKRLIVHSILDGEDHDDVFLRTMGEDEIQNLFS
ncbi:MAG: DEAD/DEAH box helicase [Clostridiaceae bacterium]|nr:DEAD/DEAH box helicase [Clostridiaceae bacterium]